MRTVPAPFDRRGGSAVGASDDPPVATGVGAATGTEVIVIDHHPAVPMPARSTTGPATSPVDPAAPCSLDTFFPFRAEEFNASRSFWKGSRFVAPRVDVPFGAALPADPEGAKCRRDAEDCFAEQPSWSGALRTSSKTGIAARTRSAHAIRAT